MGRLDIVIPDKLEERLREEVFRRYKMKKGSISACVSDAIEMWLKAQKEKRRLAAIKAHKTRKKKKSGKDES